MSPLTRVVSLVPSITEGLASVRPEAIVGATDWCTHPADLSVTRVRGTKNPNLGLIRSLRPDVVIANREENRELDVRRLRDSGVRVEVTDIRTVPAAVETYEHLFDENDTTLSNLLDVRVSNLRRKLGQDFIVTRRGHGYGIGIEP